MLTLLAERSIDELPTPDIVLVPGGPGEVAARAGGPVLEWLRAVHETSTWTTSVCTGSLILARRRACSRAGARRATGSRSRSSAGSAPSPSPSGSSSTARSSPPPASRPGIDMALALAARGRRRAGRAGDPARDRVRPAAAVRRRLAREGARRDRRAAARAQPLRSGESARDQRRRPAPRPSGVRRRPPANLRIPMAEHRYDPQEIEPRWQAVWAREHTWEVSNETGAGGAELARRAARADADGAQVLRARDAPLPERRAAHRPPEDLLGRRRDRALPPPPRPPRAAPDGL